MSAIGRNVSACRRIGVGQKRVGVSAFAYYHHVLRSLRVLCAKLIRAGGRTFWLTRFLCRLRRLVRKVGGFGTLIRFGLQLLYRLFRSLVPLVR